MIENLPIEVFFGFIAVTLVLVALGIARKVPALIVFAGMFLLMWVALIDSFNLGSIPTSSNQVGSTINYNYEPDTYLFTEWLKVIFALFSVTLMLIGALLTKMGANEL